MDEKLNQNALTSFLAEHDAPCPNCRYNLRGLTSDICPECRQRLVLSVATANPVTRAWLACILPLWIVGGAFALGGTIVWIVAGGEIVRDLRRGWNGEELFWLATYPYLVGALLLPIAVYLTRLKGRRMLAEQRRRAGIVVTCIVLSGAPLIAWSAWLFSEVN
jgi:hypothetical protein